MKIQRTSLDAKQRHALQLQLEDACNPGVEGRICGAHCTVTCPDCGSTACQCMCTHACPNLTAMLSSEGADYPIEPGIAPLVLELRRTGLFTPCWSCEGHLGPDGKLWKIPRVWFTCETPLFLRVLADMLKTLEFGNQLSCSWSVQVGHSDDDNPHTTFSLQPDTGAKLSDLASLQADAMAIALALSERFAGEAERLRASVGAAG